MGPARYSFIHSLMAQSWDGGATRLLEQRDLIKYIYKLQGAGLTAKQEEELPPSLVYSLISVRGTYPQMILIFHKDRCVCY